MTQKQQSISFRWTVFSLLRHKSILSLSMLQNLCSDAISSYNSFPTVNDSKLDMWTFQLLVLDICGKYIRRFSSDLLGNPNKMRFNLLLLILFITNFHPPNNTSRKLALRNIVIPIKTFSTRTIFFFCCFCKPQLKCHYKLSIAQIRTPLPLSGAEPDNI